MCGGGGVIGYYRRSLKGLVKPLDTVIADSSQVHHIPYESPILGQLLNLKSPPKINISDPRFKSCDPWNMAN